MKRFITCILVFLYLLSFSGIADAKPPRARKSASATARRESTESQSRLAVDADGELMPDLRAAAGIIYDPMTDEVLWEKDAHEQRSIASITKVMTATVVLEAEPNMAEVVTIRSTDVRNANHTYLRSNDKVTVNDLLHMMLIASDNAAARALARVSPHGSMGFIARMNEKASELGLTNTNYADPSGLLKDNISTAYDMARLIAMAGDDTYISGVMQFTTYTVKAARRMIRIHTTNHLLTHSGISVVGAKTGFTSPAGFCLATSLRVGDRVLSFVVLGARSNIARFAEVQNLYRWATVKDVSVQDD